MRKESEACKADFEDANARTLTRSKHQVPRSKAVAVHRAPHEFCDGGRVWCFGSWVFSGSWILVLGALFPAYLRISQPSLPQLEIIERHHHERVLDFAGRDELR